MKVTQGGDGFTLNMISFRSHKEASGFYCLIRPDRPTPEQIAEIKRCLAEWETAPVEEVDNNDLSVGEDYDDLV
jgi:hypothetical protein